MHPEAPGADFDLDNLKRKFDAGANRAITQFFFDVDNFLRFRDRCVAAGITAPIVPGLLPIGRFSQMLNFAARCGTPVPPWLHQRFEGLDEDPETRQMIAASVAIELVGRLRRHGVERVSFLHAESRRTHLRHLLRAGAAPPHAWVAPMSRKNQDRHQRFDELQALLAQRIVVLDGAMGTMLQGHALVEADYRGTRFGDWPQDLKGNHDLLTLTRPDVIAGVHRQFLDAGADIIETNTFNSTAPSQGDYGLAGLVAELNLAAASIARDVADEMATSSGAPRFVAGVLGPTNRTASLSPDVNDPGMRNISFDELVATYQDAAGNLMRGGADFIMVETVFDTLNARAALYAVAALADELGEPVPVMVSGTITDASGRTLSGQTTEAFWNSVRHVRPFMIGLNCALGAEELRPYVAELARVADTRISVHPNAGLPNEFGEYDDTPAHMAGILGDFARSSYLNMVGGCCGTTPAHIRAIRAAVAGVAPRPVPSARTAAAAGRAGAAQHRLRLAVCKRRRAHQRHRFGAVSPAHRRR